MPAMLFRQADQVDDPTRDSEHSPELPYYLTPSVKRFSTSPPRQCRAIYTALLESRRYQAVLLISLAFATLFLFHFQWNHPKLPPLYEKYHERELSLPQHNPDLPLPEGRHGKYLFSSAHPDGVGWGNFMQELVLDAYLAHKAGRAFVFDNYTWNRHGPEYSEFGGKLIPSRIPLSVLIAGPIVGGAFPHGDSSPRSVREEYFRRVCPEPAQINGKEIVDQYVFGSTTVLIEKWLEKLQSVDNRCVEITQGTSAPFTEWTFGMSYVLDAWDDIAKSPMLLNFRWSSLVESGLAANLPSIYTGPPGGTYPYTTLPGLLTLQIRRGDFDKHCVHLLIYGSQWEGFNSFPQFPDRYTAVRGSGSGKDDAPEASRAEHMRHCYPNPVQIAAKVSEILQTSTGKSLTDVYIMTNGNERFIAEVKGQVGRLKAWRSIKSSRDLVLSHEQHYIKQAIDMLIGIRSDVIIGNGWSSMSSNMAMLRMALLPDLPPDHTRYW
ncbi:hypothetical protein BXZ70DRAFT_222109 [Cristinia sonorae]|uniref:Uncharacterized protein n=1 Tax=Cristinia sonorae TaxID=1940300 RepID=A0A8K0XP85_9AGAR|nr:hypothetical protein BXZ70DRAFT_222109 [Cristinia sonorae]